jgi:hypothetical protein
MDNDRKELATLLFATMTGMLEDACVVAANGQSSRASVTSLRTQTHRLKTVLTDLSALVAATDIVLGAGRSIDTHPPLKPLDLLGQRSVAVHDERGLGPAAPTG